MISNTPCTPYLEGPEEPFFIKQENWENYLEVKHENNFSLHSPAPQVSEMVFEKLEESFEKMEPDFISYDKRPYYGNFGDEFDFSQDADGEKPQAFDLQMGYNNAFHDNEDSECSRCNSEAEEEERASISTRDSRFASFTMGEGDGFSFTTDDNLLGDTTFDLETELEKKAINFIMQLPDEQKCYIKKIFPLLISALKETYASHQLPLNDQIVGSILKELLHGKEVMVGAERQVFQKMVQKEMDEMKSHRPDRMVTENDLATHNRKEKKATKNNRNTSNLNHLHENYVSNIFQFAKRNYPEDKEIQRIGNERNVSALNFRKMMDTKLTDDIMTRKAKARIVGSGSELVRNVEYWMKDGYFDQCADREKYIYYKEKALRDLALTGKY